MSQSPDSNTNSVRAARAVPDTIHASPADMTAHTADEPPWWKPTLKESLRHLGYRWIFMLPAVLFVAGALAAIYYHSVGLYLVANIKLIIFAGGIAVSLAAYGLKQAVRGRSEPFCIHCGYTLTGLPDKHRCPECGRAYSWSVINEYRKDPQWFIQRWREHRRLPESQEPFAAGAVRSKRRRDGT